MPLLSVQGGALSSADDLGLVYGFRPPGHQRRRVLYARTATFPVSLLTLGTPSPPTNADFSHTGRAPYGGPGGAW